MTAEYDTSSHDEFVEYYRKQSDRQDTWDHFDRVYLGMIGLRPDLAGKTGLRVGDIGGGTGTLSRVLAGHGQKPVCIDVNEPLIELGRARAKEEGMDIEFHVASATDMPLPDGDLDMCIVSELLEHIEDWESCVNEVVRVLKPGGVLFLSTTNWMCPKQEEFNLPMYSWYPAPLKRHYVKRALTDRPDLANYATYPAFNWFSFYRLKAALEKRGFSDCHDQFDLSLARGIDGKKAMVFKAIASTPMTRFLAYFLDVGSTIVATKK